MEPYWTDETVTLHVGVTLAVLRGLPRGYADCCVTSPPYYGQRDYGIEGQYGLEATSAEYVETMRAVFAEVRRVLAADGTLWLNLGDSYENKRLLGIPWRVALALQDDGWILRSEIIWAKRNLKPEAVTDRPTQAHEQIFLLTKQPRYWYDAEAIREESVSVEQEAHNQRYAREYQTHTARASTTGQPGNVNNVGIHSRPGNGGRNARDVWTISQTPNPQAHFATFPVELPIRCIKAGCKPGGMVLDTFSGSGATGEAARLLGRRFTGIDLNPAYHDLAISNRFSQGVLVSTANCEDRKD